MADCAKCGAKLEKDARFCGACGSKVNDKQEKEGAQRRTVYDGGIYKCPNCGAILKSFVKNCPECGYELRGAAKTESVSEFSLKYIDAASNGKKVDLIRALVIPNTKEDILEFAILAASNIDEDSYIREQPDDEDADEDSQQEVSEAWMAKFEQAYQKAEILLAGSKELEQMKARFYEKKNSFKATKEKGEKKKWWDDQGTFLLFISFMAVIFVVGMVAAVVVTFAERGKTENLKSQVEQIEASIAEGDYDKALTQAYAMDTNGKGDNWSETRDNLISRIKQLRNGELKSVKIPTTDFEKKQYSKAVAEFEEAGFTNVKTEKLDDLINKFTFGFLHSEGEIKEIEIDGETDYEKGAYVPPDVPVIIRYYG